MKAAVSKTVMGHWPIESSNLSLSAQRLGGQDLGRKADYGVDDPRVPIALTLSGAGSVAIALVSWAFGLVPGIVFFGLAGLSGVGGAAGYMYATLWGKHRAWARILEGAGLRGDERALDIGCGRGAVLVRAAKRLPRGRAVGADIWTRDQSGNSASATRQNAQAEGVADRVDLTTADARHLPFVDGTFDLVLSSLAIHNIPSADGRREALAEALRVLKPGGRMLIADLFSVGTYPAELESLGATGVSIRELGPDAWFGNPFVRTRLVTAGKR